MTIKRRINANAALPLVDCVGVIRIKAARSSKTISRVKYFCT